MVKLDLPKNAFMKKNVENLLKKKQQKTIKQNKVKDKLCKMNKRK